MKHYKQIEVTSTGMIIAEVFCEDGRRVAVEFFNSGFLDQFRNKNTPEHIEKRCKEAHEWADKVVADKVVAVVDKYEVKLGSN